MLVAILCTGAMLVILVYLFRDQVNYLYQSAKALLNEGEKKRLQQELQQLIEPIKGAMASLVVFIHTDRLDIKDEMPHWLGAACILQIRTGKAFEMVVDSIKPDWTTRLQQLALFYQVYTTIRASYCQSGVVMFFMNKELYDILTNLDMKDPTEQNLMQMMYEDEKEKSLASFFYLDKGYEPGERCASAVRQALLETDNQKCE